MDVTERPGTSRGLLLGIYLPLYTMVTFTRIPYAGSRPTGAAPGPHPLYGGLFAMTTSIVLLLILLFPSFSDAAGIAAKRVTNSYLFSAPSALIAQIHDPTYMNLFQQLARLTDAEAELCLHGILKGLSVTDPNYRQLLGAPRDLAKFVEKTSASTGASITKVVELAADQRPKAIRIILVEVAEDEHLSPRLENWLKTARPKLIEPVTSSLVLAGIVLVLSTHVTFDYEATNGKKKLKVRIEKKPTAGKILGKFVGFFK